jgi:hypothetical protein
MTLVMGAALCVLAGAVVAAAGILLLVPVTRTAASATASANGAIVGHDWADTEEATWYYPRVAFTAAGRECAVRGRVGHLRPQPPVGSRVQVYFPRGDPQAAGLGRNGGVWAAVGLVAVGLALTAGAIWELVRAQAEPVYGPHSNRRGGSRETLEVPG